MNKHFSVNKQLEYLRKEKWRLLKPRKRRQRTAPPGLRDDRHIGFVDTKLLGKPDKFDGKDTSWTDWRFVTRAYFLAAMPDIDLLLDLAEGTDQEITNVHLDQRTPTSLSSCTTCS